MVLFKRKVARENLGNILSGRVILHAPKGCVNRNVSPKPRHTAWHLVEDTVHNLQPNHKFIHHCAALEVLLII
jgi:hypothetical protein